MKSVSRFAAWQEAGQARRESVIAEYLDYLDTTRVRVKFVTDLADLVAKHIARIEGGECNKSTLLRNPRYKSQLLSYMAEHLESGSRALDARNITDPSAKALLTTSKLEAGNLRRELERLNIYIRSLEEQLEQHQKGGAPKLTSPRSKSLASPKLSDYQFQFVRTCQAMRTLLGHLQVTLEADTHSQQILDRSKRRDNVVVDAELAGPFFEWLASQGGLVVKGGRQGEGGSKV